MYCSSSCWLSFMDPKLITVRHTTPTTLHYPTPDIHYLLVYLSLSLSWHRLSPPGRTDTIFTTCTGTNPYLCPPSPDRKGTCHSPSGGSVPVLLKCVYSLGPLGVQPNKVTRVPGPIENAYK
ncbi:hypothetical protein TIFTF001_019962 [Ficus carica]|uniref:Uncharacterized protein n=1 Tax=Ficus carica TaxID=3494 RepID=A0AA88AXE7_FICCA|nr:hypothetical protein TIFTF001_019962 [Ficus carica]